MVHTRARTCPAIAVAAIAALRIALGAAPALAEPPAKPPADKPAERPARETVSDADAQRYLAFFEKLVAVVVANQGDCARMAAAIDAHVDANQALVKELAAARTRKQLPPAVKAKLEKKIKDELHPALQKCVQDRAVKSALERLENPRVDRPRRSPPLEKD